MKLIRKISIGADYKNEAMHYSVGQEVYGGHKISDILEEDGGSGVVILRYTNSYTLSEPGGSGLTISHAIDGSDRVTTVTAGTGTVQFN